MLTKEQAIAKYKLQPLSQEGGYYHRVYEAPEKDMAGRRYAACIYYLLQAPDFSCFHRIDCDELWHFYGGNEIVLYLIDTDGQLANDSVGRCASGWRCGALCLYSKIAGLRPNQRRHGYGHDWLHHHTRIFVSYL